MIKWTTGLGTKEAQSVQDTKDCKVDIANLLFIKTGIWEKVNKLCFKRAKDLLQWSKSSLEKPLQLNSELEIIYLRFGAGIYLFIICNLYKFDHKSQTVF